MKKHLGLSGNWLIGLMTITNGLTMGNFGYVQGIVSGILITEDFMKQFPRVANDHNISGITVSCFSLGAFCGAIAAFTIGEKMGRRRTLLLGATFIVVGATLQVAAQHLAMLIIGRFLNGVGMGLVSSTSPIWQAESTKASLRGRLVVFMSFSNTFFFCFANWLNYGLYFSSTRGGFQWRFPLGVQLILAAMYIPLILILPESPRWLINHGKLDEGLATIAALWGKNLTIDHPEVRTEYYSVLATIEQERANDVPLMDVIRCRDKQKNLRRVILGMGTQFMQQFTGVNALGYYLPTILKKQLNFSTQMSKLLTACNSVSYLASAFVCLIIIDKVGRRIMMLYGSVGCCITYVVAAIAMKVSETKLTYEMGCLTVAMFFTYYVIYGLSYAKVPWVYSAEINSVGWRTRGAAAATATNWICGFCISQYTDVAVTNLGWGFYLMFALIVLCYAPVVYFFYPETSKRTLEDINYMFEKYDTVFLGTIKEMRQRSRPDVFIDAEIERVDAVRLTDSGDDKLDLEHVESSSKRSTSV